MDRMLYLAARRRQADFASGRERSQAARGLGRSGLFPCHRDDYSGLDPATIGREPAAANNSTPAMRGHESIKVSEHQESPA
jgi:hypothetical protein